MSVCMRVVAFSIRVVGGLQQDDKGTVKTHSHTHTLTHSHTHTHSIRVVGGLQLSRALRCWVSFGFSMGFSLGFSIGSSA